MSTSGGTTPEEQDRLRRNVLRAERHREDRASGRKRWRNASHALRWMVDVRHRRASPPGIRYDGDGGNFRSIEAVEQTDRALAAVYAAVKAAQEDDRARNPERPAPFDEWIEMAYLGAGRVRNYSNEQIAERSSGQWTDGEVQSRMLRLLRVVGNQLRPDGWFDEGGGGAL